MKPIGWSVTFDLHSSYKNVYNFWNKVEWFLVSLGISGLDVLKCFYTL